MGQIEINFTRVVVFMDYKAFSKEIKAKLVWLWALLKFKQDNNTTPNYPITIQQLYFSIEQQDVILRFYQHKKQETLELPAKQFLASTWLKQAPPMQIYWLGMVRTHCLLKPVKQRQIKYIFHNYKTKTK